MKEIPLNPGLNYQIQLTFNSKTWLSIIPVGYKYHRAYPVDVLRSQAIARALLNNPPVLILDESTANLDPITENEALDRILAHRRGKTTILISHRPQVIGRADWLAMLNQGELQFNGKPEDFQTVNFSDRENLKILPY